VTLFQKLLVILATAFLAVMVYDRVNAYRHEVAARQAAKEKDMHDGYEHCIEFLPYPGSMASEKDHRACLRARAYCRVNLGESPAEIQKQLDAGNSENLK
jgi:hypothetical protein